MDWCFLIYKYKIILALYKVCFYKLYSKQPKKIAYMQIFLYFCGELCTHAKYALEK